MDNDNQPDATPEPPVPPAPELAVQLESQSRELFLGNRPLFAKQVVRLKPEAMQPFYDKDFTIRKHLRAIEKLHVSFLERGRVEDEKIVVIQAEMAAIRKQMSVLRYELAMARQRIAGCINRKWNNPVSDMIRKRKRAIKLRKDRINKTRAGIAARKMADKIFKQTRRLQMNLNQMVKG